MAWSVEFDPRAEKDIRRLDPTTRTRILRAVAHLATDPRNAPNVKSLKGDDAYRLRIGDWRVLYVLRDAKLLVLVVRVGHRREVYR